MASISKERPNLKICIENTDDLSEEESSSSSESEREEVKVSEGSAEASEDEAVSEKSEAETEATLNVALDDKPRFQEPKRYENKSGDFITGFDPTSEESVERKESRAKRFGITDNPLKSLDKEELEKLYASVGITENDREHKDSERGVRFEALHMRGLDTMSTQDIFKYFQEYQPGSVEWIDDTSCNVVWMDATTAARALLSLSHPTDADGTEKPLKAAGKVEGRPKQPAAEAKAEQSDEDRKSSSEDMDMEADRESAASREKVLTKEDKASPDAEADMSSRQFKPIDEDEDDDDDDELNLMSDDDADDKEEGDQKTKPAAAEAKNIEENVTKTGEKVADSQAESDGAEKEENAGSDALEEGEIMDIDEEKENEDRNSLRRNGRAGNTVVPPGLWRIGVPYHEHRFTLYLRYATKADKKQPGAEKKSKYYIKYGNPNYGGMTGLISGSKKRRLRAEQQGQDVTEAKRAVAKSRRMTADNIPDETEFDEHIRSAQDAKQRKNDEERLGFAATQRWKEVIESRKAKKPLGHVERGVQAGGGRKLVPQEDEDMEIFTITSHAQPPMHRTLTKRLQEEEEEEEGEEEEEEEEEEEDLDVVSADAMKGVELAEEEDFVINEKELQELLGPSPKKRTMRMYADDVEDELKVKRVSPISRVPSKPRIINPVAAVLDARDMIRSRRQQRLSTKGSGKSQPEEHHQRRRANYEDSDDDVESADDSNDGANDDVNDSDDTNEDSYDARSLSSRFGSRISLGRTGTPRPGGDLRSRLGRRQRDGDASLDRLPRLTIEVQPD